MASDKGPDKASTAASSGAIAQLLIAIGGQTKRVAAAALSGALSAVAAFQVLTPPDLTAGAAAVCLARPAAGCPPLGGTAGVPSPGRPGLSDNPSLRASLDSPTCRVAPSQVGQAAVTPRKQLDDFIRQHGQAVFAATEEHCANSRCCRQDLAVWFSDSRTVHRARFHRFYLFSTGFSLQC